MSMLTVPAHRPSGPLGQCGSQVCGLAACTAQVAQAYLNAVGSGGAMHNGAQDDPLPHRSHGLPWQEGADVQSPASQPLLDMRRQLVPNRRQFRHMCYQFAVPAHGLGLVGTTEGGKGVEILLLRFMYVSPQLMQMVGSRNWPMASARNGTCRVRRPTAGVFQVCSETGVA